MDAADGAVRHTSALISTTALINNAVSTLTSTIVVALISTIVVAFTSSTVAALTAPVLLSTHQYHCCCTHQYHCRCTPLSLHSPAALQAPQVVLSYQSAQSDFLILLRQMLNNAGILTVDGMQVSTHGHSPCVLCVRVFVRLFVCLWCCVPLFVRVCVPLRICLCALACATSCCIH